MHPRCGKKNAFRPIKKADADVDNAAELDAEMEMAMAEFDIGKMKHNLNNF